MRARRACRWSRLRPTGADAEALAAADGWRWVARPAAGGYAVLDRVDRGVALASARLEEALSSRA